MSAFAGGKGPSGKQITAAPDPALSAFTQELTEQSRPVRQEVFGQVGEALKTGGIGARLPIGQRSLEATRSATSSALRQIDENLSQANMRNSGFGQRLRAETLLGGEVAGANILPNLAKEFINIAPNLALGTGSQIIGGLGAAADIGTRQAIAGRSLAAQYDIARLQAETQLISSIIGGGSGAGGQIGAAAILT